MTRKNKVIYRYADCNGDCNNCTKIKSTQKSSNRIDFGSILFGTLLVIYGASVVIGLWWIPIVFALGGPHGFWQKAITTYFCVVLASIVLLFCAG